MKNTTTPHSKKGSDSQGNNGSEKEFKNDLFTKLISWLSTNRFNLNDMKIRSKLMFGFLTITIMLVAMGVTVLVNTLSMERQFSYVVEHDNSVISNAWKMQKLVVDMETGQRGFCLTGNDKFLEPYINGEKRFNQIIIAEKALVSDNPAQVERLNQIADKVNEWKEKAALPEIALARKIFTSGKSLSNLEEILANGKGKNLMDEFRGEIQKLQLRFESEGNRRGSLLTDKVLLDLVNMEDGQRGFIITGKEEFLEPFQEGQKKLKVDMNNLYTLIGNNKSKRKLFEEIERLQLDWIKEAALPEIEARREVNANPEGLEDLGKVLQAGTGKNILDDLRVLFIEFIDIEEQLTKERYTGANSASRRTIIIILLIILLAPFFSIVIGLVLSNILSKSIGQLKEAAVKISKGNLSTEIGVNSKDEIGELATHMEVMRNNLLTSTTKNEDQNWRLNGARIVAEQVKGVKGEEDLAQDIINSITPYLDGQMGSIYLQHENGEGSVFKLTATYAYDKRNQSENQVKVGEGLIGQAALEKKSIIYTDVPKGYFSINSALGKTVPKHIMVMPIIYEGEVTGVMELGTSHKFSDLQLDFINSLPESIGIAINSARSRTKLGVMYDEMKVQAEVLTKQKIELNEVNEELNSQKEELKLSNVELEEKTQKLVTSEEELRVQQEELQQSNQELEEKTQGLIDSEEVLKNQQTELEMSNKGLEEKSNSLKERNTEVELAREDLLRKARELEVTNKYKSEFLANMSHELRTPLNSILLLSQLLNENHEKNLSKDELEYANIINTSGTNLLNLINEILDLSKIESGKMNVEMEDVTVSHIKENMNSLFKAVAVDRGLKWLVKLEDDVPEIIRTDKLRIEQVIKNLLSNAFKFTKKGDVKLTIFKPSADTKFVNEALIADATIGFSVVDTGIGIPKDKQLDIFEAFQQADGSTQREYGGTGLGLSISREISSSFGGEIQLESSVGKGSTFTLYLPVNCEEAYLKVQEVYDSKKEDFALLKSTIDTDSAKQEFTKNQNGSEKEQILVEEKKGDYLVDKIPDEIDDDRVSIKEKDKSILIIEDDTSLAMTLLKQANEHGYKAVVAVSGDKGIEYAKEFKPNAILLDLMLPVKDGWTVMEELKSSKTTKHIPVHMMSSLKVQKESLERGAIDFIHKPDLANDLDGVFDLIKTYSEKKEKNVLIIDENMQHQNAMEFYLEQKEVNVIRASSAKEGVSKLSANNIDCIILDMELPDDNGYDLLERVKKNKKYNKLPIIIYTGKNLTEVDERKIRHYANTIIVKTAESYDRLADEVSLFLHLIENGNASKKKKSKTYLTDEALAGKTVLLIDDDMRNVFGLTKALERMKMKVLPAYDGKEALEVLKSNDAIEVVLTDIMMPEMDGYELISKIRKNKKYKNLPIIAVTAKAMLGERKKCIDAGASDYISKPVDISKLTSLLRVWLYN